MHCIDFDQNSNFDEVTVSHCPHLAVEEGVVEISSSRGGEAAREQELRLVVTSFSPLSKTLEKTHIGALVKSSFGVPPDSEYESLIC